MNAIVQAEQTAIATTPNQSVAVMAGPLAGAIQALQAGMTVEQMQGLMKLQQDFEANEARKAYVADMAAFKLNPPEIYKTKLVAFKGTQYMHATLGDVAKALVDSLAGHGFSHSWNVTQANGLISVTCKITHRLGHSESTSMEAAPDISGAKNSIQSIASAQTYLQRYTLLAACGLATMDLPDDDGNGGQDDVPIKFDAANACARLDSAENVRDLERLWMDLGALAIAAKDQDGYKRARNAANIRRAELQGAQA